MCHVATMLNQEEVRRPQDVLRLYIVTRLSDLDTANNDVNNELDKSQIHSEVKPLNEKHLLLHLETQKEKGKKEER